MTVDKKMSYTAKAKSSKWKMVAYYFILDTNRVNVQTMKEKKNPRDTDLFVTGFVLVLSLVCPEMERRPNGKEAKWKGGQYLD